MFIEKLSLPRRTFLRGVSATIALPLLEAMVPAFTAIAKTAASPKLRFGAVTSPARSWTLHAGPGEPVQSSPSAKPSGPTKERVVVVSNLDRPGNGDNRRLPPTRRAIAEDGRRTSTSARRSR